MRNLWLDISTAKRFLGHDLPFFGAESPYIVDATPTSERPKGARRGGGKPLPFRGAVVHSSTRIRSEH